MGLFGNSGRDLQLKVRALDDVTQHSYDAIVAKLGPPNGIATIGENRLVQWAARGYHIAMTFTPSGECLGIDSEIAV
jgi:hypothetical protein